MTVEPKWRSTMVRKHLGDGIFEHVPPYTTEEEDDFYRRNANGPVAVYRDKPQTPQQQQTPAAKSRRALKRPSGRSNPAPDQR
jgi:hypothetical protein